MYCTSILFHSVSLISGYSINKFNLQLIINNFIAQQFFSFCGFRYQSAPLIIPSLSQKSGKQGSSWLPVEYIYQRFQKHTTEMLIVEYISQISNIYNRDISHFKLAAHSLKHLYRSQTPWYITDGLQFNIYIADF